MKLKKNINVQAFLETVKKCDGNVYFKTTEGDQLNLKSLLSQYILISIIENREFIRNGIIEYSMEADVPMLAQFLE